MVVVVSGRVKVKVNVDVCGRECCISKSEFRVGDKKGCGELSWFTAFPTCFYIALHGVF